MNVKHISFPWLSSILLSLFLVTACGGETKQAQCQKIRNILNGFSSVNTNDLGIMAKLGVSVANDLDALELGDKKLSDLRLQLSTSLKMSSESSSKLAELTGSDGGIDDSPEIKALFAQTDQVSKNFISNLNGIHAYCQE